MTGESTWPHIHALALYFNGLLVSCFVATVIATRTRWAVTPRGSFQKEREDLLLLLSLTVLAGFVRFKGLADFDIWFDEENQIQSFFYKNGLDAALSSFNMPLDYIFNEVTFRALGVDLFTARLWPAIAGTLTVPLIYFLMRQGTRRTVATGVALLGVFHPWLLAYSRECRLYAGSVFVFALLLNWMWWAWENEKQKHSVYSLLAGMMVLFLYSSILPIILLGLLSVVLICFKREKRGFTRHYWCSFLTATALWAPFYLVMSGRHRVSNAKFAIWDITGQLGSYVKSLQSVLAASAWGLVIVLVAVLIRKNNTLARPLMILALVYPFGMLLFSSPGLHAYFAARFFLLYAFIVLIAIGYAVESLVSTSLKWRVPCGAIITAMLVLFVQTPSKKLEDTSWRKAYKILEQEPEEGGVAVIFSPSRPNLAGVIRFVGKKLFLPPNLKMVMSDVPEGKYMEQSEVMVRTLFEHPQPKYVYMFLCSFISDENRQWEAFEFEDLAWARRYLLEKERVLVRLDTSEHPLERIEQFLRRAQRHQNKKELDFRYREVFLAIALLDRRCDEAREYREILVNYGQSPHELRMKKLFQEAFQMRCGGQ